MIRYTMGMLFARFVAILCLSGYMILCDLTVHVSHDSATLTHLLLKATFASQGSTHAVSRHNHPRLTGRRVNTFFSMDLW